MSDVVVLIANGANDLKIPCRIFPDMEIAKDKCDKIFDLEGVPNASGFTYKINLGDEEKPYPISNEIFTNFYYGCGSPYKFELIEINFDTKFIGFDLD